MDTAQPQRTTSMPPEMASAFDTIFKDVSWLHAQWTIFHQLYAYSEERAHLLWDIAPSFFGIVQRTILDQIYMTISRLLDPPRGYGRDNITLERLVGYIDPSHDPAFHKSVVESLARIRDHCEPFRTWRNRRIGHRDMQTALQLERLPDVNRIMIGEALRMIAAFLNQIQGHYDNIETAYNHVVLQGDGDTLVFYLEQAAAHLNAQREADMRRQLHA